MGNMDVQCRDGLDTFRDNDVAILIRLFSDDGFLGGFQIFFFILVSS